VHEVDRHHAAFTCHKKICDDCSPVPTIGPCPTGMEMKETRDAAALNFLEDTVRGISAATFACRNPRGATIVHFTAPGRVVGGVAYHPHDSPPWMVSVGVKTGEPGDELTHRHGTARPEADEITATVTQLVQAAQKKKDVCETAATTNRM
jgi:hypothetical protein